MHLICLFLTSKGRARSNNSSMYLLVEESEAKEFDEDLQNFIEIENVNLRCFNLYSIF